MVVQAVVHNASGDYEGAKSFSKAALCCNMSVMIYYIVSFVVATVGTIVTLVTIFT